MMFFLVSDSQLGADGFWTLSPDTQNYLAIARDFLAGSHGAESYLFMFGPGYAAFLSLSLLAFGQSAYPIILFQIVLSAVSCGLLYLLIARLALPRPVAIITSLLLIVSSTSASLSCMILSDTLFFFLLLLSLVLYLRGLESGSWRLFVIAGILTACAAFVRAIGQFWWVVMLVTALPYVLRRIGGTGAKRRLWDRRLAGQVLTCILIVITAEAAWMYRNQATNQVMAMTSGGSGGIANVAAFAIERMEGTPYREVRNSWHSESPGAPSVRENHDIDMAAARHVISQHPWEVLCAYFSLAWENINATNRLNRALFPVSKLDIILFEEFQLEHYLNYLGFILSITGLCVLAVRRQFRAALLLGLTFFYFAAMVGFTRWQGSRLFFPAQIATTSLAAVCLWQTGLFVSRWIDWVRRRLAERAYLDWARRKAASFLGYDVERANHFGLWLGLAVLIGLVVVFRRFLFSEMLVYSADVITYGVFFRSFLWDSILTTGAVPLWNPFIQCGIPFVASIHGPTFYPLQALDLIVGGFRGITYNFIIHFWMAGMFTYAAARQLKFAKTAAAFSAICYMFAPCLLSWITPGHGGKIYCASLFPLVILFLSRIFEHRKLFDAAMLGLVLGLILLTAHLQMAYYVFWALAFYTIWKVAQLCFASGAPWKSITPASLVGLAMVLGLCISSIQLLPSYEHLTRYSTRAETQHGSEFAGLWSMHEEELVSHLIPEFSGQNTGARMYWGKNDFKDNSESIGTIPLLATILVFLFGRFKDRFLWGTLALLALVYSLGHTTPLFKMAVDLIPMADSMRGPSSISFVFCFCISILGGAALQSLFTDRFAYSDRRTRFTKYTLIGIPVLLLIMTIHFELFGEDMLRLWSRLFHPGILPMGVDVSTKWQAALANLPVIQGGLWIATVGASVLSLLVWGCLYRRLNKSMSILLLALMVLLINGGFSTKFIRSTDAYEAFTANEVADFLKNQPAPFRAMGIGRSHRSYRLEYHRVASTLGPSNKTLVWYDALAGGVSFRDRFNPRFVNLTNTQYIICPRTIILPPDTLGPLPLDTVAVFDQDVILRNDNCYPRVFLVSNFEVIPDRAKLPWLVLHGDVDERKTVREIDLRKTVYLETEPSLNLTGAGNITDTAVIDHFGNDSVLVRVSCASNRILVMSDNYHPDWRVYVDGIPGNLMIAYGSFRAVAIPAGTKEVIFKFEPPSYRIGRYLTYGGVATTIGIFVLGFVGRNRRWSVFTRSGAPQKNRP